jgi:MFS family permease
VSRRPETAGIGGRYKWVALSNTTMAVFMSGLDGSIVIIALPAIFRGIHLDPLAPGNVGYLLWMIMGYRLIQAVLVVTVGRLGDMFGRVKIYNAGFLVFAAASMLLSFDPFDPFGGSAGAQWLIGWRVVQALGGSMLTANSAAILTDAFPAEQRGLALGVNQMAAIAGQFIGLVAGGLLAAVDWRAVFWVNVPVGVFGTVWAYRKLRDTGVRNPGRVDWWGNVTFALGLGAILIGVTEGIRPYGGHAMGWTNPLVVGMLAAGVALMAAFVVIERRISQPMFDLSLFRIRPFAAGSVAGLLGGDGARWSAIHADHLAAGNLASVARLQVHGHAAVGGHLPATADRGFSGRRADVRLPVGPIRLTWPRHCGHARVRFELCGTHRAAGRFPVPGFRGPDLRQRHRCRDVQLAEFVLDHGQRSGAPTGSRVRDAVDVPEFRHCAVNRRVLLADDCGAREPVAARAFERAASPRRAQLRRSSRRHVATGVLIVRHGSRRESRPASAGSQRRAAGHCRNTNSAC